MWPHETKTPQLPGLPLHPIVWRIHQTCEWAGGGTFRSLLQWQWQLWWATSNHLWCSQTFTRSIYGFRVCLGLHNAKYLSNPSTLSSRKFFSLLTLFDPDPTCLINAMWGWSCFSNPRERKKTLLNQPPHTNYILGTASASRGGMVPATALPGRERRLFITAVWEVNSQLLLQELMPTRISARRKKQTYQFYLVNFSSTLSEKVILWRAGKQAVYPLILCFEISASEVRSK